MRERVGDCEEGGVEGPPRDQHCWVSTFLYIAKNWVLGEGGGLGQEKRDKGRCGSPAWPACVRSEALAIKAIKQHQRLPTLLSPELPLVKHRVEMQVAQVLYLVTNMRLAMADCSPSPFSGLH